MSSCDWVVSHIAWHKFVSVLIETARCHRKTYEGFHFDIDTFQNPLLCFFFLFFFLLNLYLRFLDSQLLWTLFHQHQKERNKSPVCILLMEPHTHTHTHGILWKHVSCWVLHLPLCFYFQQIAIIFNLHPNCLYVVLFIKRLLSSHSSSIGAHVHIYCAPFTYVAQLE